MKDFRLWVFVTSCYRCHVLTGQSESYQEDFLVGIPTAEWHVSLRITLQKDEVEGVGASRCQDRHAAQVVAGSVGGIVLVLQGSVRGEWPIARVAPHRLSLFRPSWFWSWCFSTFVAFFLPCVHLDAHRNIRGAFTAHFDRWRTSEHHSSWWK